MTAQMEIGLEKAVRLGREPLEYPRECRVRRERRRQGRGHGMVVWREQEASALESVPLRGLEFAVQRPLLSSDGPVEGAGPSAELGKAMGV